MCSVLLFMNQFADVIPLPIPMLAKLCFTEAWFLIRLAHVNSITYSNACEAMFHGGVVSYTPGTCESVGIDGLWKTEISVRPNPFTDKFTLVNEANIPLSIRLFQANGLFLFETQSEQAILELEGAILAPGTYIMEVTNELSGNVIFKRILKE